MNMNLAKELEEILDLCKSMGPGPRYLFLYYGQLAITNYSGFLRWPEGPKYMIAVIEQAEYVKGPQDGQAHISEARKELFLKRAEHYLKEYNRKAG
jgi:hypothetical protein